MRSGGNKVLIVMHKRTRTIMLWRVELLVNEKNISAHGLRWGVKQPSIEE
jgi:hypothetical protein